MTTAIFRTVTAAVFLAFSTLFLSPAESAAQTLDAYNPNVNVAVDDMDYLPGGKSIICGQFTTIGGQGRRAIARLNADGTLDTTFAAVDTAFFNILDAIVQPDGKILISGGFPSINGVARVRIARLNSDGTLDTGFNVGLTAPVGSSRLALLSDGKVIVPVNFGSGSNRVWRRNSDGSADAAWSTAANFNGSVSQVVAQADGKVIAIGGFQTVDGVSRPGIARLNADGTFDSSFNANAVNGTGNGGVFRTAVAPDGKIYVGGNFTSIGGQTRAAFARLNSDGSLDTTFQDPQIVGTAVNSFMLQANGKLVIAGVFDTVGGVARKNFVRLNSNGTLDTTFRNMQIGADSLSAPNAISVEANGKILVAGNFVTADGVTRNRIARITPADPLLRAPVDFDGDGKTDVSIFRPAVGEWWYSRSSTGVVAALQFGASTDKVVPGDFTGDGKADIAFFRPSTGFWFVLRSEDSSFFSFPFGAAGDIPLVGDFDGDGKTDPTVFRPSTLTWFTSKSTGGTSITNFGASGDVPAIADYDGDGKTDIAIYRPSVGEWWINRSSTGVTIAFQFGTSTDKVVPGDYTGDGKADAVFFRPSTGFWFVLRSEDSSFFSFPFGAAGDLAAPGDYDGDGKFDAAVFRPTGSTWFANRSTAGVLIQSFGTTGDQPIPNAFVP